MIVSPESQRYKVGDPGYHLSPVTWQHRLFNYFYLLNNYFCARSSVSKPFILSLLLHVHNSLSSIFFHIGFLRRHTYLSCLENLYLGPMPFIWIWIYFLGHLSQETQLICRLVYFVCTLLSTHFFLYLFLSTLVKSRLSFVLKNWEMWLHWVSSHMVTIYLSWAATTLLMWSEQSSLLYPTHLANPSPCLQTQSNFKLEL